MRATLTREDKTRLLFKPFSSKQFCGRYEKKMSGPTFSKHLRFDVKNFTKEQCDLLTSSYGLDNFIVIKPEATPNGKFACYATRKEGRPFTFRKGSYSLAKKLGMNPADISLVPLGRNHKMPLEFFNGLDYDNIENQLFHAVGPYYDAAKIRACADTHLRQNVNRAVLDKVTEKGVLEAVRDGIIKPSQMRSFELYQHKVKEEEKKAAQLAKDLPCGKGIVFKCFKTGKNYPIVSARNDGDSPAMSLQPSEHDPNMLQISRDDSMRLIQKQKHYYFYSTHPGYGKTTFIYQALNHLNACVLSDVNNWFGVQEGAQFVMIDEYGKTNRFSWDALKRLTGGNASLFAGNRKSFGASYTPREDAQLVIFSNNHLFECLGKKKITPEEEVIMRDRFFIHKLDEEASGVTEEQDAEQFVNRPSDAVFCPF